LTAELETAYAACREIARKQAKNFYYAFVALPPAKRNAICAVYAFMRQADDISDDESVAVSERRVALDKWLGRWHDRLSGDPGTDSPTDLVFTALIDTQQRFAIPPDLLDQLVEGTATDLASPPVAPEGPNSGSPIGESNTELSTTYASFDDLYRYCYLVASVVGLVCIRIFGYRDPQAEKLAEETGVAFQLTNILRDVQEDAGRGRLYLPLEDLERCGVAPQGFSHLSSGRELQPGHFCVLRAQGDRAVRYYQSAGCLLPLISPDSRPALWVLVSIYHRLLQRIQRRNYDVFSSRVQVPTFEKLAILGWGTLKVLQNRLRRAAS
jgi:phytoene synthase